jgi:hypothetical protein
MAAEEKAKDRIYGAEVVLPVGRVRFEHVHKDDPSFGGRNITVMFKPENPKIAALRASCLELAHQAFPKVSEAKLAIPILMGGKLSDGSEDTHSTGLVIVKAGTKLVDKFKLWDYIEGLPSGTKPPELPPGKFVYPGCYARISVTPCTYIRSILVEDANGNEVKRDKHGVKLYLNGVQFYRDGVRIAGGAGISAGFMEQVDAADDDFADSFAEPMDDSDGMI